MIKDSIKVMVDGNTIEVTEGTSLLEISKMFYKEGCRKPIIASVNGKYVE